MSRLVGAPPGYVGYDEGGQLTEAVRRQPYRWCCSTRSRRPTPTCSTSCSRSSTTAATDSQGRTVDFKNTLMIMTNIGSQVIAAGACAGDNEVYEPMKRGHRRARLQFRPEFLNRVDEVIVFHALTEADLAAIVQLLLRRPLAPARDAGSDARAHPGRALELIAREGTDPTFGARPLKRTDPAARREPARAGAHRGPVQLGRTIRARTETARDDARFSGRRGERRTAAMPAVATLLPIERQRRAGLTSRHRCSRTSTRARARPARDVS